MFLTGPASANVLIEEWNDPFGDWCTGWLAQNSNLESIYDCGGPCTDNRGNNACGLWVCDGIDDGPCHILFDPQFAADIVEISLGVDTHVGGTLTITDKDGATIYTTALVVTAGFGCNTLTHSVISENGVGGFSFTGASHEGNTAIDDVTVTLEKPVSVESSSWGSVKALYR